MVEQDGIFKTYHALSVSERTLCAPAPAEGCSALGAQE